MRVYQLIAELSTNFKALFTNFADIATNYNDKFTNIIKL